MVINNFSSVRLLSQEKPHIANNHWDKFETLLSLPHNQERKAEGGLRGKGYFKHSYKYIGNECLSASNTESKRMPEDSNELMADIFLETIAGDNTGYSNLEKQEIDTTYTTDTGKWHICDTDGNPVKPAAMETQEKINEYIQGLPAENRRITFLPLITVVTVVFNGEKTLEETIQSVINQTYPNVEYIIIDGGSTDGTIDIIRKYEDAIDYWASEPDKGIYDAMNKGIILISGRWVYFLNSGDLIFDYNVFKDIFMNMSNDCDFIYGNVFMKPVSNKIYDGFFNSYKLMLKNISHQAAFYRKKLFTKYGFYNTKYYSYSDHEFNLKIFKNSKKKYIERVIAIYDEQGYSSKNIDHKFLDDLSFIIKENLGLRFFILYKIRRFIVKLLILLRIKILTQKFINFFRFK